MTNVKCPIACSFFQASENSIRIAAVYSADVYCDFPALYGRLVSSCTDGGAGGQKQCLCYSPTCKSNTLP